MNLISFELANLEISLKFSLPEIAEASLLDKEIEIANKSALQL